MHRPFIPTALLSTLLAALLGSGWGSSFAVVPRVATPGASAGVADRSLPWVTPAVQVPRVTQRLFESATVGAPVSYHIHLPRIYSQTSDRLPVLYWLHGTEGGVAGVAAREGRIIEGFSMGGYGAARLGLKHPHLFAGISILAGGPMDLEFQGPRAVRNPHLREQILREVCGGDLGYFQAISPWMAAESAPSRLQRHPVLIRQAIGGADDTIELTRRFRHHLDQLRIEHETTELPGIGHDPLALIRGLEAESGRFYRKVLGLER